MSIINSCLYFDRMTAHEKMPNPKIEELPTFEQLLANRLPDDYDSTPQTEEDSDGDSSSHSHCNSSNLSDLDDVVNKSSSSSSGSATESASS